MVKVPQAAVLYYLVRCSAPVLLSALSNATVVGKMPNRTGPTVCYGPLAISVQKPPTSKTHGRQARHPKYCCVITRDTRVSPLTQYLGCIYNAAIAQPRSDQVICTFPAHIFY